MAVPMNIPEDLGPSRGIKRARSESEPSGSSPPTPTKRSPQSSGRLDKTPRTISSTLSSEQLLYSAVTFGLEFEMTLAFQEEELKQALGGAAIDAEIVKLTTDLREHSNLLRKDDLSNTSREIYPSWVLKVPIATDESHQLVSENNFRRFTNPESVFRRYVAEPLLIAQKALQDAGGAEIRAQIQKRPEVTLKADPKVYLSAQNANYDGWTLTNDHTIIGARESELLEHLGDRMRPISEDQPRDWDSAGIELVSRKFEYAQKDLAFEEIGKYLNALRNGETWTAFDYSVWASLHVHVGFDAERAEDISLRHLQHVAYIFALHEDLVSKCHPRNRSGILLKIPEPTSESEESEYEDPTFRQIVEENETRVRKIEAEYTGPGNVASNVRYLRVKNDISNPSVGDVAAIIFREDIDLPNLIAELQRPANDEHDPLANRHRGYMYNWNNLLTLYRMDSTGEDTTWKSPKPTIEFRQHAATLDLEVVKHWVKLLFAIINFAQRKAEQTTKYSGSEPVEQSISLAMQEESKYPSEASRWPCSSMAMLCGPDVLCLDQSEIDYWTSEFDKHSDERPGESDRIG